MARDGRRVEITIVREGNSWPSIFINGQPDDWKKTVEERFLDTMRNINLDMVTRASTGSNEILNAIRLQDNAWFDALLSLNNDNLGFSIQLNIR